MKGVVQQFRTAVLAQLKQLPRDGVFVAASAGVDSTGLMLGLIEVGIRPTVISFTLDDRESTDYLAAKANAGRLGLNFLSVVLPTDLDVVEAEARRLIAFGYRSKAAVEAGWPISHVIDAVALAGGSTLVTGSGADGHYVLSKRGMIHYRQTVEKMDEFRQAYYATDNGAQVGLHRLYASRRGVSLLCPYVASEVCAAFRGTSWDEVNRPREKEITRAAFPGMSDMIIGRHSDLHRGDSGVRDLFAQLLDDPTRNPNGARSTIALYNAWARETAS